MNKQYITVFSIWVGILIANVGYDLIVRDELDVSRIVWSSNITVNEKPGGHL